MHELGTEGVWIVAKISVSHIGNTSEALETLASQKKNHAPFMECSYLYTCSGFLVLPSLNISFAQYFIENADI